MKEASGLLGALRLIPTLCSFRLPVMLRLIAAATHISERNQFLIMSFASGPERSDEKRPSSWSEERQWNRGSAFIGARAHVGVVAAAGKEPVCSRQQSPPHEGWQERSRCG